MDIRRQVGRNVRRIRGSRGWSQEELAHFGLDCGRHSSVATVAFSGGTPMDRDRRNRARRLFANATAKLEDAAYLAASGQSPRRSLL